MKSKHVFILSILLVGIMNISLVFAQEAPPQAGSPEKVQVTIEIHTDEPKTIEIFDASGFLLTNPSEITSMYSGWLIHTTTGAAQLIVDGYGSIFLGPYSYLSIDKVDMETAELFLLSGRSRLLITADQPPLNMNTPVARYSMKAGEYVLISEGTEIFYTVEGEASAFSKLSKTTQVIEPLTSISVLRRTNPVSTFTEEQSVLFSEEMPIVILTTPTPETQTVIAEEVTEVPEATPPTEPSISTPEAAETQAPAEVSAEEPVVIAGSEAPEEAAPKTTPESPLAAIFTKGVGSTIPTPEATVPPVIPTPDQEVFVTAEEAQPASSIDETDPTQDEPVVIAEDSLATSEPEAPEGLLEYTSEPLIATSSDDENGVSTPSMEDVVLSAEPITVEDEDIAESSAPEAIADEQVPASPVPSAAAEETIPEGESKIETSDPLTIKKPAPDIIASESSSLAQPERETATRPSFGVDLSFGAVNTVDSTVYDPQYVFLETTAWYEHGSFSAGLTVPLMFTDDPLLADSWYLPRGNDPYDFGTGYSTSLLDLLNPASNFAASRDFYLDLLSLVDHITIGSSEDAFQLRADDHSLLSFGTGALVSDLNPAIDYPFIRRVGLLNTLTSSFFDYELMINDLSHAELYGLRLAAKPMGTAYPLEIGLYTLADISLEPENRFILTPGIDITAPIIFDQEHASLQAFIDFSVLLLANNSGLHIDSFFSTGLYNYLITAGLSGSAGDLSYAVSAAYHKGFLAPNLFGNDYSWRRGSLIDTLFADTDYTTGISATPLITTYAELGYAPGPLALRLAYEFNLTGSFGLIGFDGYNPDVLSLSVSWQDDPLEVGLNFRQRGFGYRVANEFSFADMQSFFFNDATDLSAFVSYSLGDVTLTAALSGSAQYQDPPIDAVLNNIDNILGDPDIIPTFSIGSKIRLF